MCAVLVIVMAALALAALIVLARLEARRRDRTRRREWVGEDSAPVADVEAEVERGEDDPERGLRRFVTVAELVEREGGRGRRGHRCAAAETTAPLRAPVARRRPSPCPRRGQP